MFLYKTILALILTTSLLFYYSCNNRDKVPLVNTIDTARINNWQNNFDTLYEK